MSTPQRLALDGELAIVDAAAQRLRLMEAIRPDGDLWLDLSAVQACDSAGIQLLLATQHSLTARGDTLRLLCASEPVRQALHTFGLQGRLVIVPEEETT